NLGWQEGTNCRAAGVFADLGRSLLLPGHADKTRGVLPTLSYWLSAVLPGLDWLVRLGPIVRGECTDVLPRPAHRFPLGILPDGSTGLHSVDCYRHFPDFLEPGRLLWLALSFRSTARAGQQAGPLPAHSPDQGGLQRP